MTESMIPGAFQKRPAHAVPQPAHAEQEPAAPRVDPPIPFPDRAKLEREREGGGSPSQRKVKR
jgi:hypothetical protein